MKPTLKERFQVARKAFFAPRQIYVNYGAVPIKWAGDTDRDFVEEGYQSNADLYSVISLRADNAPNIEPALYEKKNGELERLTEHEILTLLSNPAPGVTYSKFIGQVVGYLDMTGDAYIWAPFLERGRNAGKTVELDVLPSQFIEIKTDSTGTVTGYELQYAGKNIFYPAEEICHISLKQYDFGQKKQLYGMSPIRAAIKNLSASNEAITAHLAKLQNRGVEGFVGVKGAEGTENIAGLKKKWNEETGGNAAGKVFWIGSDITWQRTGLTPVELDILKAINWNLQTFCNIYKVPSIILDPNVANTYNNLTEAYAALYSRSIIPTVRDVFNALTNWLLVRYADNLVLKIDVSNISELQKDNLKQAQTFQIAYWLTENEKRRGMGYEELDEPEFDEAHIPANYVPLGMFDDEVDKRLNAIGKTDGK
nr:hypothetical protein 17 [bacterium]